MAYLLAHLAWPLILLALAGGAAGWFWHAIRTEAALRDRDRTRAEVRAAMFAVQDDLRPLEGDEADWARRLNGMERDLVDARRRAAEFEALAAERDGRVAELRGALVEADAHRARVADLEVQLAAVPAPVDVASYEARIAALETERDAALARAPESAVEPVAALRTQYLEQRVHWAERGRNAAEAEAAESEQDKALAAANAELADLRTRLATAPNAAAEDELNVLRWQSRYLGGRVRFLEQNAPAPAAAAALAVEDPEEAARAKWRMRYLTSRIAYLEGREKELSAAPKVAIDPNLVAGLQNEILRIRSAYGQLQAHTQAAVAAANERQARIVALERDLNAALEMAAEADGLRVKLKAFEEAQASAVDPADLTRLRWTARYLDARVRWLEARLAEVAVAPKAAETPEPEPVAAAPAPEPEPVRAAPQPLAEMPAPVQAPVFETERPADRRAPTPPPEPRYVWRRVRVADEPAPAARERAVWRRAAEEPVEPVQRPRAAPAPVRAPRPAPLNMPTIADRPPGLPAPRGGAPDDLRMIAGVGPKIESTLNSLGIYHFDQIAAWTPAQISWIDQYLSFRGRVTREDWIDQARALARGEETDGKRRYLQGEHV